MRDPHPIGRQYRTPLLPVRRSLTTGYVGRLANFSGTPRQLLSLHERADRRVAWWFSHTIAAGVGAVLVLAWVTR